MPAVAVSALGWFKLVRTDYITESFVIPPRLHVQLVLFLSTIVLSLNSPKVRQTASSRENRMAENGEKRKNGKFNRERNSSADNGEFNRECKRLPVQQRIDRQRSTGNGRVH